MIKPLTPFSSDRLVNEDLSSSTLNTLVDLAPTFEMLVGHRGHGAFAHEVTPSIQRHGFKRLKTLLCKGAQVTQRGSR
jgi:hypothetical protein